MSIGRDQLREFLVDRFRLDGVELDDDTQLFSTGLLDSFSMIELVMYLEQQSGEKLRAGDFNLENLDSVDRILRFMNPKG